MKGSRAMMSRNTASSILGLLLFVAPLLLVALVLLAERF
jgi:hypothetical protein